MSTYSQPAWTRRCAHAASDGSSSSSASASRRASVLLGVRMSACMPAPPLGSEAAKVSTIGGKSAVGSAVEDMGRELLGDGGQRGQTKMERTGGGVAGNVSRGSPAPMNLIELDSTPYAP